MKKNIIVVMLVFCLMLILVACSGSNPIVGKWTENTSGVTMEFLQDGTVNAYVGENLLVTAIYSINEDNIIIDDGQENKATFKIEGDTLTITPTYGEIEVYTRNNQS